jgi:hypothetical protein
MTLAPGAPAAERLFALLLPRYRAEVPDVERVFAALRDEGALPPGGEVENDHVAFRTFGAGPFGLAAFERLFVGFGYEPRDRYQFPHKRLDARWYAPPSPRLPRVFASELRVAELSDGARATIARHLAAAAPAPGPADGAEAAAAYLGSRPWPAPAYDDYARLADESEYAAWTLCHGHKINHVTLAVHALPAGYDTVERFNAFLERRGFALNASGGRAKTSPDGLLVQSSTLAAPREVEFAGGVRRAVPGAFVEFAERRPLPAFARLPKERLGREHRREGFEAANADKIFESTDRAPAGRR